MCAMSRCITIYREVTVVKRAPRPCRAGIVRCDDDCHRMTASPLTADDLALRPGQGRRSPWLREALASEGDPQPLLPPSADLTCDVAIIGGGYTGLWTALNLKEHAPEVSVTVLEQDICGGGPSGRNGGF